jgi:diacylglycerol kinase (ATP)
MNAFFASRARSFRYAFAGLLYVLRTQRNAWIHLLASALVVLLAAWLRLGLVEWAILILTIGSVWTAEFVNTALEAVVDLASPNIHPLAKVGKDVGAAAVLISAMSSAVIGFMLLGPPLLQRIQELISSHP